MQQSRSNVSDAADLMGGRCFFCCRVLQPGGSFLLVTLGDPTRRLPLLCDARLPWKVSLLLLPKISAANQAYVDGK